VSSSKQLSHKGESSIARRCLCFFHFIIILFLFSSFATGNTEKRFDELTECLIACYGINSKTAFVVSSKLTDCIDLNGIDEFIKQSRSLQIDFRAIQEETSLPLNDAVLAASEYHKIVFESPYVRITHGIVQPNERVPFHSHQWKSILVVLQGASFLIENEKNEFDTGTWPAGVYVIEGDKSPYAYTNTSSTEFEDLNFEIKKCYK
jgi:hypothetical protein